MITTTTLSRVCESLEKYVFDRIWNDPYAEYRTYTRPMMLNTVPVSGHMGGRYSTILLPPDRTFSPTTDRTFTSPKTYYTLSSVGTYVPAEVTYGDSVTANTYYELNTDDYTVYMDKSRVKFYVFAVPAAMFGAARINVITWTPLSDYCNENFPDLQLFTKSGIFLNKGNILIKPADKKDCMLFAVESTMFERIIGKLGHVRCTSSTVNTSKNLYTRSVDDGYNIYWHKVIYTENIGKVKARNYTADTEYYHFNNDGDFYVRLPVTNEKEYNDAVGQYGVLYTNSTDKSTVRIVDDTMLAGTGTKDDPYTFIKSNDYYEDDEIIFGKYYDSDTVADNKILSYQVSRTVYNSIHSGASMFGIDTATYSLYNGKLITGYVSDYRSDIKTGDYIDSVTDDDVIAVLKVPCFDKLTYVVDTSKAWMPSTTYYYRKQNPTGFGFIYDDVEINSSSEYFEALSRFGTLFIRQNEIAQTYTDSNGKEKLLVHIPKAVNPDRYLITPQTCDIWLVPRKLRKWNPDDDKEVIPNPCLSGVYISPCGNGDKFSQISFNDFSIDMDYIRLLADENLMVDGEYEIRVYARWHKRSKVVIRDANYTDLLYSLDDDEIIEFLRGMHEQQKTGKLMFWSAAHLETSKYAEALLARRNQVWQKQDTQCDECGLRPRCSIIANRDGDYVTDVICPYFKRRNVRDYLEILGYYHVLNLVANRVSHFKVTQDGANAVIVDTPLAHACTDMHVLDYYPVVYHNGYRVDQDRISFGEASAGVTGVSKIIQETHELYDKNTIRPEFSSKLRITIDAHYSITDDIVFQRNKQYFIKQDGKFVLLHGCYRDRYDAMLDAYDQPLDRRNNYQYCFEGFISEYTVKLCEQDEVFAADRKYVFIPMTSAADAPVVHKLTDDVYFKARPYYKRVVTVTDGVESNVTFEALRMGNVDDYRRNRSAYDFYYPYCSVTKDTVFNKDKIYYVKAQGFKEGVTYYCKKKYTMSNDGTQITTEFCKDYSTPGELCPVEIPEVNRKTYVDKHGKEHPALEPRIPGYINGPEEYSFAVANYGELYYSYTQLSRDGKPVSVPTTISVYEQYAMKLSDYPDKLYVTDRLESRGAVEDLQEGFDYRAGDKISDLEARYAQQGRSIRVGTPTGVDIYETDDEYRINDTICVELLDDRKAGSLRTIEYPVESDNPIVIKLIAEDHWQLYEVIHETSSTDSTIQLTRYKPITGKNAGTVEYDDETGGYELTLKSALAGKELLFIEGPLTEDSVCTETITTDRYDVLGGYLGDWKHTATTSSRETTDFPFENAIVFLNGRRMIEGLDYTMCGRTAGEYRTSALVNQNLSYLQEQNTFSVIRNDLTTVTNQRGFLNGTTIANNGAAPLWFSELSVLTIDGRVCSYFTHDLGSVTISDGARDGKGELFYRNGAPYEIKVAVSSRVLEVLANQDLRDEDEAKLAELVAFFARPSDKSAEIETIIPYSHKIYSVLVAAIIDKYLEDPNYQFGLIGETYTVNGKSVTISSIEDFINQFSLDTTTKLPGGWTFKDLYERDIAFSLDDATKLYVDIYSMYHRTPSEYRENYARLQTLSQLLLTNDNVKHKDAEYA